MNILKNSENEPSLHDLIEKWLEKQSTDEFIDKYLKAVNRMFKDLEASINDEKILEYKQQLTEDYLKKKQLFDQLTNEERYNQLLKRGDRRISFKAFKTLLCIFVNKDDYKYCMMFQILNLLLDIDVLINDWRSKLILILI